MSVTAAQRGLHRPIHDDTCFSNTKPKVDTASVAQQAQTEGLSGAKVGERIEAARIQALLACTAL